MIKVGGAEKKVNKWCMEKCSGCEKKV